MIKINIQHQQQTVTDELPPRQPWDLACDWWRAGHVTTILLSDWSRQPDTWKLGEGV